MFFRHPHCDTLIFAATNPVGPFMDLLRVAQIADRDLAHIVARQGLQPPKIARHHRFGCHHAQHGAAAIERLYIFHVIFLATDAGAGTPEIERAVPDRALFGNGVDRRLVGQRISIVHRARMRPDTGDRPMPDIGQKLLGVLGGFIIKHQGYSSISAPSSSASEDIPAPKIPQSAGLFLHPHWRYVYICRSVQRE